MINRRKPVGYAICAQKRHGGAKEKSEKEENYQQKRRNKEIVTVGLKNTLSSVRAGQLIGLLIGVSHAEFTRRLWRAH